MLSIFWWVISVFIVTLKYYFYSYHTNEKKWCLVRLSNLSKVILLMTTEDAEITQKLLTRGSRDTRKLSTWFQRPGNLFKNKHPFFQGKTPRVPLEVYNPQKIEHHCLTKASAISCVWIGWSGKISSFKGPYTWSTVPKTVNSSYNPE